MACVAARKARGREAVDASLLQGKVAARLLALPCTARTRGGRRARDVALPRAKRTSAAPRCRQREVDAHACRVLRAGAHGSASAIMRWCCCYLARGCASMRRTRSQWPTHSPDDAAHDHGQGRASNAGCFSQLKCAAPCASIWTLCSERRGARWTPTRRCGGQRTRP
jgi:hypothetical protein